MGQKLWDKKFAQSSYGAKNFSNARYRSHAIIGEFLKVLASVIEEQLSHVIKPACPSCIVV